jgi:hypothetical protein
MPDFARLVLRFGQQTARLAARDHVRTGDRHDVHPLARHAEEREEEAQEREARDDLARFEPQPALARRFLVRHEGGEGISEEV